MNLFGQLQKYDYEQLIFCYDAASGLKGIICIHDTTLGPALGGCRMWPYATEEEAVIDVLRLARAMTYKAAAAGLNLGGGKSVIIGDPTKDKTEALFRAMGRYVQSLGGRYIIAEDVGTTERDMDWLHMETDFVTGMTPVDGVGGNPAPLTAYGVFMGIKAAAKTVFGTDSLAGRRVAVQGLGSVGFALCERLHREGAELVVSDIRSESVQRAVETFGAQAVEPENIYDVECDIFSPCALGGVINDGTIPRLKAKIVAGSANNQLLEDRHGMELKKRGILYAPDYVINAGGLIHVADEWQGYNRERVYKKIENIYDNLLHVFDIARRDDITTQQAADRMAEARIAQMAKVRSNFVHHEKTGMPKHVY